MKEDSYENQIAQEEANFRTDYEQRRIYNYQKLRYGFRSYSIDCWIEDIYQRKKHVIRPVKKPSRNQIRKKAGITIWENALAFLSPEKKKKLDEKKAYAKDILQSKVDFENENIRKNCELYNSELRQNLKNKRYEIKKYNEKVVREYFCMVLYQDCYTLDGEADYPVEFRMNYDSKNKQLIVDYLLPIAKDISRVKEWEVNKNNEVVPKNMPIEEYRDMYERILMDISIRTVGILFESDTDNVLDSIIFNGECQYKNWQERPTALLSFLIYKSQYSYDRISKMDCVSKEMIAELKNKKYVDKLTSSRASSVLLDMDPNKSIVPIKSCF